MEPFGTAGGTLDEASRLQLISYTNFLGSVVNTAEIRQTTPAASLSLSDAIHGYSAAPYRFDSVVPVKNRVYGLTSLSHASSQPQSSQESLKHPSPADWETWKPEIIHAYKHGTARMILEELCKERHVTYVWTINSAVESGSN